jgi:hypothetical protein
VAYATCNATLLRGAIDPRDSGAERDAERRGSALESTLSGRSTRRSCLHTFVTTALAGANPFLAYQYSTSPGSHVFISPLVVARRAKSRYPGTLGKAILADPNESCHCLIVKLNLGLSFHSIAALLISLCFALLTLPTLSTPKQHGQARRVRDAYRCR